MPAKPKVLITDATGQVGALVTSYLKADSSVEVIAAARSLEKAKAWEYRVFIWISISQNPWLLPSKVWNGHS